MSKRAKSLVGMVFGDLVVIERFHDNPDKRQVRWRCKCSCGNETVATSGHLTQGAHKRCRVRHAHVKTKRYVAVNGYAFTFHPAHPKAGISGFVLEHIVMMEHILQRYLFEGESVHHINGVKDDNRPENLELWATSQPSGQRVQDLLIWAREIIARYA